MSEPNSAMAEAWGGDMGRRWVLLDADLQAQMAEVHAALMTRARLQPGERVLDLGCGSGAVTRDAASAVGPEGSVLGLDLSAPLLELARRRAPENARVALGDAQAFHFGGDTFDVVLSRFGVMFFDDPVAAFANVRAAMVPGARLVFAAWAEGTANPWFSRPREVAEERLGRMPAADPDAPGPLAFRHPDRVLPILLRAGFAEARSEGVDLHLTQPDGWSAMERLLPAIGPIPGIMREKGGNDADLRAIIDALRQEWEPHLGEGGLRLPARIVIYSAENAG
ncbi:methyltransferase [Roseivivax halodurans JCM 10272]|uniref:Methyltransferase n=1 Tax=Roseivivax halodurans JCM 10272 TaxID=1449350 RepID=X7ECG5_9RHOB|nr:class I SAM-dependent methyltransferase [Roseivivax halodurans]ETX12808.1 methyltransferase [Roseivivax halodurans JCM 10272]